MVDFAATQVGDRIRSVNGRVWEVADIERDEADGLPEEERSRWAKLIDTVSHNGEQGQDQLVSPKELEHFEKVA